MSVQAVKELLSDPSRWTQGEFARDDDGYRVNIDSSTAVKWCLLGACIKLRVDSGLLYDHLKKKDIKIDSLTGFNDTHTHSEVMDALS
jgi:hypothetical protein